MQYLFLVLLFFLGSSDAIAGTCTLAGYSSSSSPTMFSQCNGQATALRNAYGGNYQCYWTGSFGNTDRAGIVGPGWWIIPSYDYCYQVTGYTEGSDCDGASGDKIWQSGVCSDPPPPDCSTLTGNKQNFSSTPGTGVPPVVCYDTCEYESGFGMTLSGGSGTSWWQATATGASCTGGNTTGVSNEGDPVPDNCVTGDSNTLCDGALPLQDTYNGEYLPDGQLPDNSGIANSDGTFTTPADTYNPAGDETGDETDVVDQPGTYTDKRVHDNYTTLPPGTAVDTNGDGVANAVAKDNDGNGITDELRNADGTTYRSDNPDGTVGTDVQFENDTGTAPPVQGDGSFEGDGDPSTGSPGDGEGDDETEQPTLPQSPEDNINSGTELERLGTAWNNSQFMTAINGVTFPTGSSTCPPFSLDIFETTISTDWHCQLYTGIEGAFSYIMLAAWSLLGLFIILGA
jgi:hypothetical protein